MIFISKRTFPCFSLFDTGCFESLTCVVVNGDGKYNWTKLNFRNKNAYIHNCGFTLGFNDSTNRYLNYILVGYNLFEFIRIKEHFRFDWLCHWVNVSKPQTRLKPHEKLNYLPYIRLFFVNFQIFHGNYYFCFSLINVKPSGSEMLETPLLQFLTQIPESQSSILPMGH